jgi:hypothetical protein
MTPLGHISRIEQFKESVPFGIDTFEVELFAERLIRKHILMQHVEPDHPVLITESRLVGESTISVLDYIEVLSQRGSRIDVRRSVLQKAIGAIRTLIRLHDVEDDFGEEVILQAEAEASVIICPQEIKRTYR